MKWEIIILIAAALGCYLLIRRSGKSRDDDSRAGKLMKKYATLTEENLAATADEELVEAVVCHVLSRAEDSHRPNPAKELAGLPQPFTVVYSIWAVCKEMSRGDYTALTHTATRHLVQEAIDALPLVGAPMTAAALTALRDIHTAKEDDTEAHTEFHRAVEQECPLALCVTYIRDHVPQLLGREPQEETPALSAEETADEE